MYSIRACEILVNQDFVDGECADVTYFTIEDVGKANHMTQYRKLLQLTLSGLVLSVISGCITHVKSPPQTAKTATPEVVVSSFQFGTNTNLNVYGQATATTIAVIVLGEVQQPGLYHIHKNSTVKVALDKAGGLTLFAWWMQPYSGIIRPSSWKLPSIIEFKKGQRENDEMIVLKNGDQLFIGHEVY